MPRASRFSIPKPLRLQHSWQELGCVGGPTFRTAAWRESDSQSLRKLFNATPSSLQVIIGLLVMKSYVIGSFFKLQQSQKALEMEVSTLMDTCAALRMFSV